MHGLLPMCPTTIFLSFVREHKTEILAKSSIERMVFQVIVRGLSDSPDVSRPGTIKK